MAEFNICNDCKHWSQMIAQVLDGEVQALCLSGDSPYNSQYTKKEHTCAAFEAGSPVDDPKLPDKSNGNLDPEPIYEPTEKAEEIEDFLEDLTGRTTAITSAMCVKEPAGCGKPVIGFRNEISEREYRISGLCQVCQDSTFGVD